MPQKVGTVTSELILDTRRATQEYQRFERTVARNRGRDNFMSSISADAKDFDNSLGKATNRVVAFGAAAAVFTTISKGAYEFAKSIVEIDNSLAKINVNLGQSQSGLKKFGADLFNIARQTGQTFEVTAKAAEELARQGLSAEETTKRLKDSLILSRIAGLDAAESVETLTAAINSFNEEALTSTEIVNKFAAVDTKFAVSSKDLAEAVSRVGSTAQSAGVGIDQLIGLVTSLQQTTARGGATIGNGLKTIFTRIQAAPETVAALEGVGVAIKNTDGSLRDALSILRDYGQAREKVGEVERAALDRTVAGTFQINILKAALTDLNKEYSIYGNAVRTSADATDEAIRKNEKLNETIASLLNSTGVSIKQLFANIGGEKIGPILQTILKGFERIRAFFSGDSGSDLGKSLGEGLLQGITNVLSGPALGAITLILFRAFGKVVSTIAQEARTLLSLNSAAEARANIQKQINTLLGQATEYERAQYAAATSVLEKKEQILAIQARINQESLAGTPLTRSFQVPAGFPSSLIPGTTGSDKRLGRNSRYIGIPGFVMDPISAAVGREVAAGAPAGQVYVDRDARVASFANPMGLLVANRRDEPLGGYQGVNRVLSQGGNPKTNGIPGFAATRRNPFNADEAEIQSVIRSLNEQSKNFGSNLKSLNIELKTTVQELKRAPAITQYAHPIGPQPFASNIFRNGFNAYGQRAAPENIQQSFADPKQGQFAGDGGYAAAFLAASRTKNRSGIPFGPAYPINPNLLQRLQARDLASKGIIPGTDYDNPIGPPTQVSAARQKNAYLSNLRQRMGALTGAAAQRRSAAAEQKLAEAELKRQRRSDRTLGTAFIAPFIGGFAEPIAQSLGIKTGGGTAGGVVTGAISSASQFAGFGALTGNPAIAGGAAALGALVGIFSKLTKSSEELGAELDDEAAKRNQEAEAISRVRALREQLKDAQDSGENPAVIRRLNDRLVADSARVTSTKGQAVLSAAPGQAQDEAQHQYDAANDLKDAARNIADLLAGRSKGKLSTAFAGGINPDVLSSLTPDKIAAIRRASLGTFDVQEKHGKAFGEQTVSNQAEVDKANEDYKEALDGLLPILTQFGLTVDDITKGNLKDLAQELTRGVLQVRKATQDVDKNKTPAGGLPRGSFISAPNLDVFANAGSVGRTPGANRNQRAQSRFDFFNELSSNGGIAKELLEGNKDFRQARAGVQNQNVTDLIIKFLQGNNPSVGSLRDARGNANLTGIERTLSLVAGSGTQNSGLAKTLVPLIPKLRATLSQEKVNSLNYSPDFDPTTSGLGPGIKYTTQAGAGSRSGRAASFYRDASSVTDNTQYYRSNSGAYTDHTKYDLVQGPPNAQDTALAAKSQAAHQTAASRDADIDAYLKIAEDAKTAAENVVKASAQVSQQALNVTVAVNGAIDPTLITAMQAAIQQLFDQQAASSGRPNPPAPPPPPERLGKSFNRLVNQVVGLPD